MYVAGAFKKQARVYNNTIAGRWERGVYIASGALPGASTYSGGNNLIDGRGASSAVGFRNDSGVAITSAYDCVVGVASSAGANVTLTGLLTTGPLLDVNHRPLPGSPLIGAGTHLGYRRDMDGKQRPNPPSIGAFDVARVKPA